jgi:hypothetical protein
MRRFLAPDSFMQFYALAGRKVAGKVVLTTEA